MAKIRMVMMKDRTDEGGRHPVYLRVSDRGKRGHFATGFWAEESRFVDGKDNGRFAQGKGIARFDVLRKVEKGTVTMSNREANDELASMESKLYDIISDYTDKGLNWSFEQLRSDFISKPQRSLFLPYVESIIEKEYIGGGHFQSAEIARQAIESLKKHDPSLRRKAFSDINIKYLQGYMDSCRQAGNSQATISIRVRQIRRFWNLAIRDGVASKDTYPFSKNKDDSKVKVPKASLNRADQYLTNDSLKALASTPSPDFIKERTRHLFLFSFYCRGINWKDMALLRTNSFYSAVVTDETTKENMSVTMMRYRRSKTNGAFDIQVTPNIQRELDWFRTNTVLFKDYVLPIISTEVDPVKLDDYIKQVRKRFNRSLKELCRDIGLDESQCDISIYTARHSFAMAMQNQNKPVEVISQALGHQSVETTKHYLAKFSTTKMAEDTDFNLCGTSERSKPQKPAAETAGRTELVSDRILKMAELVRDGVLTGDEFKKLKEELLGTITS